MNIVHDLGLEEGLGSVVHDLVAELGLGNVLTQLLDAGATGLGRAVLVNDFVTLALGRLTVGQLGNQLLDDLELATEERVLGHVHLVAVHLEQVEVDPGHSLHEALVGSGQLELPEEAGSHAASGGARQANLPEQFHYTSYHYDNVKFSKFFRCK